MRHLLILIGSCLLLIISCKQGDTHETKDVAELPEVADSVSIKPFIFGVYDIGTHHIKDMRSYEAVTVMAYPGYLIDPKTGKSERSNDWETTEVIDSMQAQGIDVLMQVTIKNAQDCHGFLRDRRAIATFKKEFLKQLAQRNALGVHIVFDEVRPSDRRTFSAFIQILKREFIASKYQIYLSLPKEASEAYDVKFLNNMVDRYVLKELQEDEHRERIIQHYLNMGVPEAKLVVETKLMD
ncbi:hypothetical protein ACU8DI_06420 [Psychroserpens sp. BH13MA-6]